MSTEGFSQTYTSEAGAAIRNDPVRERSVSHSGFGACCLHEPRAWRVAVEWQVENEDPRRHRVTVDPVLLPGHPPGFCRVWQIVTQ